MSATNQALEIQKLLKTSINAFEIDPQDMSNYGKAMICIQHCRFSVPYETASPMPRLDLNQLKEGDTIQFNQGVVGRPAFLMHNSGKRVLPIFTDDLAVKAREQGLIDFDVIMSLHFSDIFTRAENYDIGAIILNPFTNNFPMPKPMFENIKKLPKVFDDVEDGVEVSLK